MTNFKLYFFIAAAMMLCQNLAAEYNTETIGNIYYEMDSETRTATVGHQSSWNLTGAVTIPSHVVYEGVTYKVTTLREECFEACKYITSIKIPNSVKTIGIRTFRGCTSLTSVVIGSSVTSIDAYAFYGCDNLSTVTCLGTTPPTLGSMVFTSTAYKQATLYVPKGSADAYKKADYSTTFTELSETISTRSAEVYRNADGWKNFVNIVEGVPTAIKSVKYDSNEKATGIYDIEGRKLSAPQKGINIINGKKVLVK